MPICIRCPHRSKEERAKCFSDTRREFLRSARRFTIPTVGHCAGTVASCSICWWNLPLTKFRNWEQVAYLGVAGTVSPEDDKLSVLILNRDLTKGHDVEINWQDKAPEKLLNSIILTGSDLKAFMHSTSLAHREDGRGLRCPRVHIQSFSRDHDVATPWFRRDFVGHVYDLP